MLANVSEERGSNRLPGAPEQPQQPHRIPQPSSSQLTHHPAVNVVNAQVGVVQKAVARAVSPAMPAVANCGHSQILSGRTELPGVPAVRRFRAVFILSSQAPDVLRPPGPGDPVSSGSAIRRMDADAGDDLIAPPPSGRRQESVPPEGPGGAVSNCHQKHAACERRRGGQAI